MEWIKDVRLAVVFVFLALILAYGAYDTVGVVIGTDTPVVSVVSNSMNPTFYKGDLLLVRGANFSELEEGDIIVYKLQNAEDDRCARWKRQMDMSGIPIVHRIVQKNETFVQTKGDNEETNPSPDPCLIQPEEVKGEVYFIIPKIGWIKLTMMRIISG